MVQLPSPNANKINMQHKPLLATITSINTFIDNNQHQTSPDLLPLRIWGSRESEKSGESGESGETEESEESEGSGESGESGESGKSGNSSNLKGSAAEA